MPPMLRSVSATSSFHDTGCSMLELKTIQLAVASLFLQFAVEAELQNSALIFKTKEKFITSPLTALKLKLTPALKAKKSGSSKLKLASRKIFSSGNFFIRGVCGKR